MISSNSFTVEYRNTTASLFLTASTEDRDVIESHRWRHYRNTAVTVIGSQLVTMDSVLLGISPDAQVKKRNRNPHDFTRSNLTLGRSHTYRPSRIEINGSSAFLILRNAETVIIDADDVPLVEGFDWCSTLVRSRPVVMTVDYSSGVAKKIRLTHRILGLNAKNNHTVTFLNDDPYDCRKANLTTARLVIEQTPHRNT